MSYNAGDTSDIDITDGDDSERRRQLKCLTGTGAGTSIGCWRERWRGLRERIGL